MNHARLENSPRLQRVDDLLGDGEWHSTRDIMLFAYVCAVNSCIAELRANGRAILCRQRPGMHGGRIFEYRMEAA